jgi:hypothetical protein
MDSSLKLDDDISTDDDPTIDSHDIFVIWNSKKKRVLFSTFNEELARKVTEHYVDGVECSTTPVYSDIEEYLDDNAEVIAEEAIKKLTPMEYEAIKRNIEDEYPANLEFDHQARIIYE